MNEMTATEHRDAAMDCLYRQEDSFQRSDTDGFLSQWANGLQANLHMEQATIIENGGRAQFCGLYEGDRRVAAKIVTSQFNGHYITSWMLRKDEAEKFGRRYIPVNTNSRIQKKLNLRQAQETAPAKAIITGRGRGLSGSAWVTTVRTGDEWGTDSVLCND